METNLKFETALKRLEEIVESLEQGDLSLDDSLGQFEEGVNLIRFCSQKITEAEKKVEILSKEGVVIENGLDQPGEI